MAFRPLHDNVLVRRLEAEEEQQGGIIIPDTAKEKPQEGQILAVGPGRRQEDARRRPAQRGSRQQGAVRQVRRDGNHD